MAEDERFMREALALAKDADMPFGAVIVKDGAIVARGANSGQRLKDPTAHGEMMAIRACLAASGPQALVGATLYTTGEPCIMCMGAAIWCHIGRVVYAASIAQLSTCLGQVMITCEEIMAQTDFVRIDITGGVLADEAMQLFTR
jgi:tRNA(Arg) A34 adenosine deaminase TadA